MIIYVAPKDEKMRQRTLEYARKNQIRMVVVDEQLLFQEVNQGKKNRYASDGAYAFGEAETIWIVGHGNAEEIGDQSKGVTLTSGSLVGFLKSIVIADGKKYHGSIVIDTCKSGVRNDQKTTFADRVYDGLKNDFPNVTAGGWIGSVHGPISGGETVLLGEGFSGNEGFAWAKRTCPADGDHGVLARLA